MNQSSFNIYEIIGILHLKLRMRDISHQESDVLAKICLDIARQYKISVSEEVRISSSPSASSAPQQTWLPPSRGSPQAGEAGMLQKSMVQAQHDDALVQAFSSHSGLAAGLTVHSKSLTLTVWLRQAGVTELCVHPMGQMRVVTCLGSEGELVYMGHEKISDLRVAVVLKLESVAEAQRIMDTYRQARVEYRENKRHRALSTPAVPFATQAGDACDGPHATSAESEADHSSFINNSRRSASFDQNTRRVTRQDSFTPADGMRESFYGVQNEISNSFYETIGYTAEDQSKFYECDAVISKQKDNSGDDKKLQPHLKNFISDEVTYVSDLNDLIRVRNSINNVQVNHELRHWDMMQKVHAKMNLSKFVEPSVVRVSDILQTLIYHSSDMKCYIDYVRRTHFIEKTVQNYFISRELKEKVISTRKRIVHYFLTMESWREYIVNDDEEKLLKEAIGIMKDFARMADSLMTVDAVKKCPFGLSIHLPLLKQGLFKVIGKGFKKNETYQVLLFKDLLVFNVLAKDQLNCLDAMRLEQLLLIDRRRVSKVSVTLQVNYGERRGAEIIELCSDKEHILRQWENDIMQILTDLALKVKNSYTQLDLNRKRDTVFI